MDGHELAWMIAEVIRGVVLSIGRRNCPIRGVQERKLRPLSAHHRECHRMKIPPQCHVRPRHTSQIFLCGVSASAGGAEPRINGLANRAGEHARTSPEFSCDRYRATLEEENLTKKVPPYGHYLWFGTLGAQAAEKPWH